MKLLKKRQNVLENRIIETVHDDMLTIAKATLHDINQIKIGLNHIKLRINHITIRLLTVEEEIKV